MIKLLFFCTAFASLFLNFAPTDLSDMDEWKFLSRGMETSRKEVTQWEYEIRGKYEKEGVSESNHIYQVVDQDKLSYRIDESRVYSLQKSNEPEFGQFVRTPEKVIRFAPGDNTIAICGIHDQNPGWVNGLDFRVSGLAFVGDIRSGKNWDYVWKNVENFGLVSVEKVSESEYLVKLKKGDFVRELLIDEKKGFWPISMKVYMNNLETPIISSFLSVEKFSNIWLPRTLKVIEGESVIELDFDWKKINCEIDPRWFNYSTFASKKGTNVVDFRGGQPVILEFLENQSSPLVNTRSFARRYYLILGLAAVGIAVFLSKRFFFHK